MCWHSWRWDVVFHLKFSSAYLYTVVCIILRLVSHIQTCVSIFKSVYMCASTCVSGCYWVHCIWFLHRNCCGRHFADDILRCIFLNENDCILIQIWLKLIPNLLINNIPALLQFVTCDRLCCWAIIWANGDIVYRQIYASLGPSDLNLPSVRSREIR